MEKRVPGIVTFFMDIFYIFFQIFKVAGLVMFTGICGLSITEGWPFLGGIGFLIGLWACDKFITNDDMAGFFGLGLIGMIFMVLVNLGQMIMGWFS